jgi:hypothetical protein
MCDLTGKAVASLNNDVMSITNDPEIEIERPIRIDRVNTSDRTKNLLRDGRGVCEASGVCDGSGVCEGRGVREAGCVKQECVVIGSIESVAEPRHFVTLTPFPLGILPEKIEFEMICFDTKVVDALMSTTFFEK